VKIRDEKTTMTGASAEKHQHDTGGIAWGRKKKNSSAYSVPFGGNGSFPESDWGRGDVIGSLMGGEQKHLLATKGRPSQKRAVCRQKKKNSHEKTLRRTDLISLATAMTRGLGSAPLLRSRKQRKEKMYSAYRTPVFFEWTITRRWKAS